MTTRQWTHLDKSTWGDGPWQQEADKVQWTDTATGLPCLAVRAFSHWCGYVGVAEGHPLFGVEYSDCPQGCTGYCGHTPDSILEVHGGITFAGACQEDAPEGHGVCHIPEPGQPDHVWWFGFDCAHGGDYSPTLYTGLARRFLEGSPYSGTYRDLGYVQAECQKLAAQLVALGQ